MRGQRRAMQNIVGSTVHLCAPSSLGAAEQVYYGIRVCSTQVADDFMFVLFFLSVSRPWN